ncbi:hypothetical protein CQ018_10690 [Arthrobacter sp. MYb227]|uniref:toll/interleukin-1 receptor domain-containing protein n=1 Tax=Arthrobacter sp. MYb227 TaxID=1848601 RepID=UPI000CFDE10C|nr:toll/interleukin-1 receptor domain-containing protein [Arthrobacter sp. MYb227]PQZ92928.1 hypothetical protein CQ018_10690 [Arthrobacter sp. MYb227]
MADFMISYASADRDEAQRIAALLRSSGHSVWLDVGGLDNRDVKLPGIPGGQDHWSTIRSAIDDSSTFLILETAKWHASEYCQKEHEYARTMGKRVAALGEPLNSGMKNVGFRAHGEDLPNLVRSLEPGNIAAASHSRLVSELNSVISERSWVRREQIKDAETLSTATLPEFGVSLNSSLQQRVGSLLATGRKRRHQLRVAIYLVIGVLLVLSAAALFASQQASLSNINAQERANFATSLQLAQQAIRSQTTKESLELAKNGLELSDNDATNAAFEAVQANAFRSTAVIPSGSLAAAAVSNDGRTTILRGGLMLYVVDAAAGSVAQISLTVGFTGELKISPDGTEGYGIDENGVLNCFNTDQLSVTKTPQKHVVAFDIGENGELLWVDQSGGFFRSAGCPTTPVPVIATGFDGLLDFHILGSTQNILSLSMHGRVDVHELPHTGGHIGTPLKTIDLSTVPVEGETKSEFTPNPSAFNSVIQCGDTIHVVAGIKGVMRKSTHVAVSLRGELLGQRRNNMEMMGVGCSPSGQAWAAPMLGTKAIELSSDGFYPIGEIDARDAGTRTVIANSTDNSHTVVAHSDGRVNVLSVANVPWAEAAGQSALAVPLTEGMVTVDSKGTVRFNAEESSTVLGKLEGTPVRSTAATSSTAYFAVGNKIHSASINGLGPSITMSGPVKSLILSNQGKSLIVHGHGYLVEISIDFSDKIKHLELPSLVNGEEITSVEIDGTSQILATDQGRVLVADEAGRILAEVSTGVAGIATARALPDHTIVVVGGNGMLNKYGPSLELLDSHLFGPMAVGLQASQDGRTLLVSLSGDFSVWAVNAQTLQPISRVATKTPDIRLINVSADGRTVVQVIPENWQSNSPAYIVKTRLLETKEPAIEGLSRSNELSP